MIARHLQTNEEYIRLRQIQQVAFTRWGDSDRLREEVEQHGFDKNGRQSWGAFLEDGTLAAGMCVVPFWTRIGAHWGALAGIGSVASLPEHRRGGAIRSIFQKLFAECREQGIALSGLYPFSHAFYRQFGYELCYSAARCNVPTSAFRGMGRPCRARMVEDVKDVSDAQAVYDAISPRLSLCMRREEPKDWEFVWKSDVYKDRAYRYVLYDENDAPEAYLSFCPDESEPNKRVLSVWEMLYTTPVALRDLLGFLYRFHPHYHEVRVTLPTDVSLASLLDNPYELKQELIHAYMIRVLDPVAALEMLDAPSSIEGRFTLSLSDAFLPENEGCYEVCLHDGRVSARRTCAQSDLSLDVTTLAQLVTGFLSLDQAACRPDVRLSADVSLARALFVPRTQYLGEHY